MPPKANSTTTTPKTTKRASGLRAESPVKQAQPSLQGQTFIVRPAAASNLKSAFKVYHNLETLRSLGLTAGESILLSKPGERGIIGVVTPSTSSIRDDTIEIPRSLRSIAGFLLGDRVAVEKHARPEQAVKVIVQGDVDQDAVRKSLEDIGMVMAGLQFKVAENNVTVVDVQGMPKLDKLSLEEKREDDSVVAYLYIFSKSTDIEFTDSTRAVNKAPVRSRYTSLGGLGKVIKKIQSAIELPLHNPGDFERFDISPERGFLLHGPPGTGKSTLMRAIAFESDVHVLTVNGPSIVSRYLGGTEEALRKIFEEAREFQPSIVFIDEIDSLVPKRDSDDSGEAESRVVSTLLTLMDYGSSPAQICVIGATNRINKIDPALRRPGRFGAEFEIGIPDIDGRAEILHLLLHRTPHKFPEGYVESLASRTHGYVGSDLDALKRDAAMRAIQRGIHDKIAVNDRFVETDDFEKALLDIRPSAMREVILETPKVHWTDIGGQEEVKQSLHEAMELPLSHPEVFKRLGVQAPRGILLYGPPGCSKTLIAKALATESGLNFLAVKGPEIFNKYVGESERAIREVFRKARAAAPSVIFFDEIDAISTARGSNEGSGDRVLISLLNEMDGIEALNGVTILAATNRPDTIDTALMRPGRLDRKIYVPPPDFATRQKILEIQFKKMAINQAIDIQELVEKLEGCSGAEVVAVCQEAGMLAIRESIDAEVIELNHFDIAISKLRRIITPEMIDKFEEFSKLGS